MIVDGWLGFCFGYENFCNIGEGFYETIGGLVFTEVVAEGLTSDNKSFDAMADQLMITGHFCGKVLILLDLKYSLNGLKGHCNFTVVGNIVSFSLRRLFKLQ